LFTATAARLVATFSARAAATSLTRYPSFLQSDALRKHHARQGAATIAQKGALLTSAAGLSATMWIAAIGWRRGGSWSRQSILQKSCTTSADGSQLCDGFLSNPDTNEQVVNLWRTGGLVGGNLDVSIELPDQQAVRDLGRDGSPVLLGWLLLLMARQPADIM